VITQLAHNAYRVRDLDASLSFYTKLGIREAFRLYRDDGSTLIVYLQINKNQFVDLVPTPNLPASTTSRRPYVRSKRAEWSSTARSSSGWVETIRPGSSIRTATGLS
jgi:catechol 2,3-dioxygenase-like lactoylglutathione lyase family enzyme